MYIFKNHRLAYAQLYLAVCLVFTIGNFDSLIYPEVWGHCIRLTTSSVIKSRFEAWDPSTKGQQSQ